MDTSIDTKLIQNFLEGDVHSFNRLVRRWQDRLFRFAYRYMMDEEDAKDIVQAAFIKAYKNMKKLKNPDRFSSWIFQITVNLCKDNMKSSHRNKVTTIGDYGYENGRDSEMQLDDMPDETDLSANISRSDIGEIVRKTISALPEKQRVVIIMKEYDGLKFSEIAEILNCPVNTVKARMYYGLQHMQKILGRFNIDKEVLFNEM